MHRPAPRVTHGMPDMPDIRYTLRSGIAEGQMVFIGVGGAIDGQVNPVLIAAQGQIVQVTLINGEGAAHDVVFPDQSAQSPWTANSMSCRVKSTPTPLSASTAATG